MYIHFGRPSLAEEILDCLRPDRLRHHHTLDAGQDRNLGGWANYCVWLSCSVFWLGQIRGAWGDFGAGSMIMEPWSLLPRIWCLTHRRSRFSCIRHTRHHHFSTVKERVPFRASSRSAAAVYTFVQTRTANRLPIPTCHPRVHPANDPFQTTNIHHLRAISPSSTPSNASENCSLNAPAPGTSGRGDIHESLDGPASRSRGSCTPRALLSASVSSGKPGSSRFSSSSVSYGASTSDRGK
jgi:hypothetical protein